MRTIEGPSRSRCLKQHLLLRRRAKQRIRATQECFKVASGGPEVASECPEVALELVRDIFEFFDLFFQGKEIIMRKN